MISRSKTLDTLERGSSKPLPPDHDLAFPKLAEIGMLLFSISFHWINKYHTSRDRLAKALKLRAPQKLLYPNRITVTCDPNMGTSTISVSDGCHTVRPIYGQPSNEQRLAYLGVTLSQTDIAYR